MIVQKIKKEKPPQNENKSTTFDDAFLKAWQMGEKTFTWNGMLYTTERADKRVVVE